jgi:hypothetical protein
MMRLFVIGGAFVLAVMIVVADWIHRYKREWLR